MDKIKFPKIERSEGPIPPMQDTWDGAEYFPNPNCKCCRGVGFLHPLNAQDQPEYNKIVRCDARGCLEESYREFVGGVIHIRAKGVTGPAQTFETFDRVPGTQDALKYAKHLADGEGGFVWLLIYGGTGNGKTHLCNAIMITTIKNGIDCEMISVADLYSKLRIGMNDHTTDAMIQHYKDITLLILDEYNLEYGSKWEEEKFEELMSSRWANVKPTVLVTNSNVMNKNPKPDEKQFPERIKSRFKDGQLARIVFNSAPDYRNENRDCKIIM